MSTDTGHRIVCGTRAVRKERPGDFRVVCATCGEGGTVSYPSLSLASSACIRDSSKPCRACGAS